MKKTVFAIQLILAIGCFAADISLDQLSKIVPDQTTKSEITKSFGSPSEVIDFKKYPVPSDGMEWRYKNSGLSRVSFFFNSAAEVMNNWSWYPGNKDPERLLKNSEAKFPGAQWVAQTEKWINPHAAPYECFYKDEKLGISITVNLVHQEVYEITRWNPSRVVASDKDDKPPLYCMGIKPNTGCTPAIPAVKFFEVMGMPVTKYCEEKQ